MKEYNENDGIIADIEMEHISDDPMPTVQASTVENALGGIDGTEYALRLLQRNDGFWNPTEAARPMPVTVPTMLPEYQRSLNTIKRGK